MLQLQQIKLLKELRKKYQHDTALAKQSGYKFDTDEEEYETLLYYDLSARLADLLNEHCANLGPERLNTLPQFVTLCTVLCQPLFVLSSDIQKVVSEHEYHQAVELLVDLLIKKFTPTVDL